MAKDKSVEKESHGLSVGKIISIVILVFTMVPISVLGIVYFTNDNFKYIANQQLSNMPGIIGKYFQSFPTREERDGQIKKVAGFLLEIEVSRAADKLILIQKEDETLFSELVKTMAVKNGKQTEKIMELIRDSSIKKDILVSTLEQIDNEKKIVLSDQAKYYETLSSVNLIEEINNSLGSGDISFHDMGRIVEQMNEKIALNVLSNMDEEIFERITSNFEDKEKARKLQGIVNQIRNKEKQLIDVAQIYNTEKAEKLIEDLGSTKKFKIEELSVIYRNMNVLQGGRVLSKVQEQSFIFDLLQRIKEDETVQMGKDLITPDLIKTTKIFSEYDEKVKELVDIYKKMEPKQIAEMISKLYKNNKNSNKYALENGESLTITDQDIAMDVLRSLSQKIAAEVLANLDVELSSQISKTLALPK